MYDYLSNLQRSTLLEKMDLSKNQFANLDYTLPPSLKQLSLSSNPLTVSKKQQRTQLCF